MPAKKQWKFDLDISEKYTEEERKAIAIDVIDFIVKRTQKDNLDKRNRPFAPYSKGYKKSLDFKIAGKGPVDLTLSGDMMASLKVLRERAGKLTVGFEQGLQNDKAEGNILGTYGQKKPVAKPRDFLGITQSDFRDILSKYPLRNRELSMQNAYDVLQAQSEAEMIANVEET